MLLPPVRCSREHGSASRPSQRRYLTLSNSKTTNGQTTTRRCVFLSAVQPDVCCERSLMCLSLSFLWPGCCLGVNHGAGITVDTRLRSLAAGTPQRTSHVALPHTTKHTIDHSIYILAQKALAQKHVKKKGETKRDDHISPSLRANQPSHPLFAFSLAALLPCYSIAVQTHAPRSPRT
jgi:hypothetical protein